MKEQNVKGTVSYYTISCASFTMTICTRYSSVLFFFNFQKSTGRSCSGPSVYLTVKNRACWMARRRPNGTSLVALDQGFPTFS